MQIVENSKLSDVWDKVWFKTAYGISGERKIRVREKINNLPKMGLCFKKDQKVLDAGCGSGVGLAILVRVFQVVPFGMDISKNILDVAKSTISNSGAGAVLTQGDVRNIPFADSSFDVVMSWGVIEHFPEYEVALEEFYRVLQPGGTLNLIQPNKFSPRHIKKFYLELTGKWEFGMQINFSPNFLCKLLGRKGFKNIRYVARPYLRSGGIINFADVLLNLFSKNWGYYLYILAEK